MKVITILAIDKRGAIFGKQLIRAVNHRVNNNVLEGETNPNELVARKFSCFQRIIHGFSHAVSHSALATFDDTLVNYLCNIKLLRYCLISLHL